MYKTGADARAVVTEAVLHRRSVRAYRPEPVPDEDIRELLRLASRAPSAWNLQPWRFIVVRDPAAKSRLQAAAYGQRQVGSAPVVMVVYSDMVDVLARVEDILPPDASAASRDKVRASIRSYFAARTPEERDAWGAAQAGIALGYLLLIAEAFSLATSPMLGFDPAAVRGLFALPAHAPVVALVALGYPAEEGRPSQRRDVEDVTRWL